MFTLLLINTHGLALSKTESRDNDAASVGVSDPKGIGGPGKERAFGSHIQMLYFSEVREI